MNEFESAVPASIELRKYISYYYFHVSNDKTDKKSYYYYPHYLNALTAYQNSKIEFNGDLTTIIKPSNDNTINLGYAKLIKNAAWTEIHQPFNKIGIVFQPLGLNQFLDKDLCEFIQKPISLDVDFFSTSIIDMLKKVFHEKKNKEKVRLLDSFFLSELKEFNQPVLQNAIDYLLGSDIKYSVESLSNELGISRKTLLRLFRRHQNCSASEYINLVRFRKAMKIFHESQSPSTLTKLAYQSNYYDQSEFINHFKKMTGFNPKSFFKDLSKFGSQSTFWTPKL